MLKKGGEEMKELKNKIKKIVRDVYKELGGSDFLGESEFQRALAIGFKKNGLRYLREPNVEIIYKGENIRPEGGQIDFIVFDKEEKNGILLEIKHKKKAEEAAGEAIPQAWIYMKSIRDAESTFPKFIREKIKGGLVINFEEEEKKEIGEMLKENIQGEYAGTSKEFYDKYTENIEIWNVSTESTPSGDDDKKEEKRKGKKKEKGVKDE